MSRGGRLPRPAPSRRRFLQGTVVAAGAMSLGPAFWRKALSAPAQPGLSTYGAMLPTPDVNGLLLPAGFTSRIVAVSGAPVADTGFGWHPFPDGSGTFATDDGGWILVSNSENPPPAADLPAVGAVLGGLGGASAIRFAADGSIVDAYPVLEGSRSNCAGGTTPWGTWLSCEEWEQPSLGGLTPYDGGKVHECDPTGARPPVVRLAMGAFKHEMAAIDPDDERIYLSEDLPDGRFYRFTPDTWTDLSAGLLEAARVDDDGRVDWLAIADPTGATAGAPRLQQPGSTPFNGGEGCTYDRGVVYLTTKGDDRVWAFDVAGQRIEVLYDAADFAEPVLTGVDNIVVSRQSGDIIVAEDGGNLEAVIISPDLVVSPLVRLTGPQHGVDGLGPLPLVSEVSGLAFNPDGTRLYLNSQRGNVLGITYEVTGPFRGSPNDPALAPPTTAPTTAPAPGTAAPATGPTRPSSGRQTIPATGATLPTSLLGAGALAAAAAAWRARRALDQPPEDPAS
ncbi:hypothetical protein BH20ACT2_BH20ACT2_12130 [soil metagenome]